MRDLAVGELLRRLRGAQPADEARAAFGPVRNQPDEEAVDPYRVVKLAQQGLEPAVALLLLTSYLATGLAAVFPVLMAPILDLALGSPVGGPTGAGPITPGGLTLGNLGAAFFQWVGVRTVDDRFRAIVLLCVAYVATGFLKGWLDFGNFLLALWIRVRAGAHSRACNSSSYNPRSLAAQASGA